MCTDYQLHWDKVYSCNPIEKLGWYEEKAEKSIDLIEKLHLDREAHILIVGGGTTTLINDLLKLSYRNLIVSDISRKALDILAKNLGQEARKVKLICDDLTKPHKLLKILPVDLWHDRAVLHFFTEEWQRTTYFNLLKKTLKPGGFVILAEFSLNGAEKCSGLPVFRYNIDMMKENLGEDFILIQSFNYTYFQPSGDKREFVYALFRRNE